VNVIVDFRTSEVSIETLKRLNYNVIKTPMLKSVYDAICGHADIMLHKTCDNEIICEPSIYDYFKLKLTGCNTVKGESLLNDKYPYDIAYNVCCVSNKVFCNTKYTDKKILYRYNEMDYEIIDIKQGYAKCSVCVVSDNAIITGDKGIAKAAEKNNIDVLLTSNDDIKLPGMNNGFIGGATGLLSKDRLAVNGNIEYHRDCRKIIDFCTGYGVEIISLNTGRIVDIGSIITV